MKMKVFRGMDPMVQLIFLVLLSVFSAGVFVLMAQGLVNLLWGVNLLEDANYLQNYDAPYALQMNRLLLVFQHFGLFIVPAWLFAQLVSVKPTSYLLIDKGPSVVFLWAAVILMIIALVPVNYLGYLNGHLNLPDALQGLETAIRDMEDQAAMLTEAMLAVDSWHLWALNMLVLAVLPAIGEELLFRGALLHVLVRWIKRRHVAVWVCAAVFSFIHFQFYGFLPRLLMGALLGYLVIWSGSLLPAMIAHFINNGLAVTFAFAAEKGWVAPAVEDAGAGPEYLQFALMGLGVLLIGMWWTSRRSHWHAAKQVFFSGE